MESKDVAKLNGLAGAHAAIKADDLVRLRLLSMRERSTLIESACEAAAIIQRSRMVAGLPPVAPAPWPASTWEFSKRHAARVRT